MKVEHIKIEGFKGIDRADEQLNGNTVYLVGNNGSGKTSFIDAVFTILTNRNVAPETIQRGKAKSKVEIDLGDYVATYEKKKTAKTPKFELTSKDGAKIGQPRTILNDLVGIIDFNPSDFFKMSPKKQVEYFCTITGIDVSDLDAQYAETFEQRTFENRELRKRKDAFDVYDVDLAKRELISVSELAEKVSAAGEKRSTFERVRSGTIDRKEKAEALKKELAKIQDEIDKAEQWMSDPENIPLSVEQIDAMKSELSNAEQINNDIMFARNMANIEDEIEQIKQGVQEMTDELANIIEQKKQRISEQIKIDGLEYDGEQFLFNGLPFDANQINTAAQIIAGLRIGASMLKDVRILRLDGSLIDRLNMDDVLKWSKENDIQLFVELMERDGDGLKIIIDETE